MREIAVERLAAGMAVLMQTDSPVRQWMRRHRGGSEKWLTPTHYNPSFGKIPGPTGELEYILVEVAKVMPPYVVVFHDDGDGSVTLWIDMREVTLFAAE